METTAGRTIDAGVVVKRYAIRLPIYVVASLATLVAVGLVGGPESEWVAKSAAFSVFLMSLRTFVEAAGRTTRQFFLYSWLPATAVVFALRYIREYIW